MQGHIKVGAPEGKQGKGKVRVREMGRGVSSEHLCRALCCLFGPQARPWWSPGPRVKGEPLRRQEQEHEGAGTGWRP